jgi:hypothetical protein
MNKRLVLTCLAFFLLGFPYTFGFVALMFHGILTRASWPMFSTIGIFTVVTAAVVFIWKPRGDVDAWRHWRELFLIFLSAFFPVLGITLWWENYGG